MLSAAKIRLKHLKLRLHGCFDHLLSSAALSKRAISAGLDERAIGTPRLEAFCQKADVSVRRYMLWLIQRKRSTELLLSSNPATIIGLSELLCPAPKITAPIGSGIVIVVPHYGNFIPAIISLAARSSLSQDVIILYASDSSAPSNAAFDIIATQVSPALSGAVEVCHDDLAGISRCLRKLKSGAMLIIMPDVCPDRSRALHIPLLDGELAVLCGTAGLARVSRSSIALALPAVPGRREMTILHPITQSRTDLADGFEREEAEFADYCTMRSLFSSLDIAIEHREIFWQYWFDGLDSCTENYDASKMLELVDIDPVIRCRCTVVLNMDKGKTHVCVMPQ